MKVQSEFSPVLYACVGGIIVVALGIGCLVGWEMLGGTKSQAKNGKGAVDVAEHLPNFEEPSKKVLEDRGDVILSELSEDISDNDGDLSSQNVRESDSAEEPPPLTPIVEPQAGKNRKKLSAEDVFELSSPAVFRIAVLNETGDEIGGGSGFIVKVDDDKLFPGSPIMKLGAKERRKAIAVTNYHVLENAVDVRLDFPGAIRGVALEVWNQDETADVSLLCIALNPSTAPPSLSLSGTHDRTGANVFAIGSPRGLVNSLSTGIISGVRQGQDRTRWIQTTASISPGSSGGPLLNEYGEVIGITTASETDGQQLNFAVAASEIIRVLSLPPVGLELWRGKSFEKEEEAARLDVFAQVLILEHKTSSDDGRELDSMRSLEKALNALASDEFDVAEEQASLSIEDLPTDFEYLANFAIGKAIFAAANERYFQSLREVMDSGRGTTTAALERIEEAFGNECKRAMPWLKTSVQRRADFSPAIRSLCLTCLHAGQKTDALVYSQDLVRVVPKCAMAFAIRGDVRRDLREYGAAVNDYKIALQLDPNCSAALLGLCHECRRAAAHQATSPEDRRRLMEQADELEKRLGEISRRERQRSK